jgi:hypothetical protein
MLHPREGHKVGQLFWQKGSLRACLLSGYRMRLVDSDEVYQAHAPYEIVGLCFEYHATHGSPEPTSVSRHPHR